MSTSTPRPDWPAHLHVGALRVARSSNHYEATVAFYRDLVGLEVIDEFRDSYSEDGPIFGLPDSSVHLEIVRSTANVISVDPFDQLVLYLPNRTAVHDATKKLIAHGARPARQHPYWHDHGAVTYQDPDGRALIYVPWIYGRDSQPPDGHDGDGRTGSAARIVA
jgi:hypothetical protein